MSTYQKVVEARRKLQGLRSPLVMPPLPVVHAAGGFVSDFTSGNFGQVGKDFGHAGGHPGSQGDGGGIGAPASGAPPNVLVNPAQSLTPQNTFQATTPGITTTDFTAPMKNGLATAAWGQALTNQRADAVSANAQQQAAQAGNVSNSAKSLGQVLADQQSLAGQLQNQANGQGPNPAQQQFQQNVNQNIAQEAGAIGSVKGLNPALAAKMAGENAGAQNQAAAGQSATLQAQQQLAAEQALGAQQAAEGQTLGTQGSLYATAGNVYGGAGQTQGVAGNLTNDISSQGLNAYQTSTAGLGNQNNAVNTASLGTQGLNAGVSAGNANRTALTQSGLLNSAGGAVGGLISSMAGGGEVADQSGGILGTILAQANPSINVNEYNGGKDKDGLGGLGSTLGGALGGALFGGGGAWGGAAGADSMTGFLPQAGGNILPAAGAGAAGDAAAGAGVESILPEVAMVAAGGGRVAPGHVHAKGKTSDVPAGVDAKALSLAAALMARGGQVPGTPNVHGNAYKNDVVPAALSPKEIVLPLSVTEASDAPAKAAAFVEKLKTKSEPTYAAVLKARRKLEEAHKAHHKACGGMVA